MLDVTQRARGAGPEPWQSAQEPELSVSLCPGSPGTAHSHVSSQLNRAPSNAPFTLECPGLANKSLAHRTYEEPNVDQELKMLPSILRLTKSLPFSASLSEKLLCCFQHLTRSSFSRPPLGCSTLSVPLFPIPTRPPEHCNKLRVASDTHSQTHTGPSCWDGTRPPAHLWSCLGAAGSGRKRPWRGCECHCERGVCSPHSLCSPLSTDCNV